MPAEEKSDGRREAGQRTRRRLLEATRTLLAQHGRAGVTLRAITDCAEANVASVSYHFGSTEGLLQATIQEAVDALAEGQIDGLRRLGKDASVADVATAWARPMIAAVSGPPSEEQALIRTAARAATDPSPEFRDRVVSAATRAEPELAAALERALPGVPADELRFRMECAGGILYFMATGIMRVDLETKSGAEVERLLVPAITGALVGCNPSCE
jgi:AcrR family transcriptional regulator